MKRDIPEPANRQLGLIIGTAFRRGRRIGIHIAHTLYWRRATAQALHDHYTGAQSRAAKRRMSQHLRACHDAGIAKATRDYLRRDGQTASRHVKRA